MTKAKFNFELYPLLKVALFFIVGMILGRYTTSLFSAFTWLIFVVGGLLLALLALKKPVVSLLGLFFAVLSMGGCLMAKSEKKLETQLPTSPQLYNAVLLSEPVQRKKVIQVDLAIQTTNGYIKTKASILRDTLTQRYLTLHVGDGILAYSALTRPYNFVQSEFDYARWLKQQGYLAETFIYHQHWQKAAISLGFLSVLDRTILVIRCQKQRMVNSLKSIITGNNNIAVLLAMGLGDKTLLTKDLKDDYSISGASHILAISGLHLSIIYIFLLSIFSFWKYLPLLRPLARYRLPECSVVLLIWAYVFLVDFSPSVVRSATMLTIYTCVTLLNRNRFSLNTLAFTALVLLVVRPQNLWDIGFQLSFSAVFAILLFMPLFDELVSQTWLQRHFVFRYLWSLAAVSVSAQLGTAPLVAYYFGGFSTYFLFTNFIVIPCTLLILYGMVIASLLLLLPKVHTFLFECVAYIVDFMNTSISWIAHLPYARIALHPTMLQVFLVYVVIACVWFLARIFVERQPFK